MKILEKIGLLFLLMVVLMQDIFLLMGFGGGLTSIITIVAVVAIFGFFLSVLQLLLLMIVTLRK